MTLDTNTLIEKTTPLAMEQPSILVTPKNELAVAFLRHEKSKAPFVLITPNDAKVLVDNQIRVFMQPAFVEYSPYTSVEYANVGVEFVEDLFQLTNLAQTLVQYHPFSMEQLDRMKENQILFSTQNPFLIDPAFAQKLQEKKITVFAMNLLRDADGQSRLERILSHCNSSVEQQSVAVSNFVLPLLMSLLCSPRLRFALQRDPSLMNCVYCFEGQLCNLDSCNLLNVPFRDILSLCWELN